MSRSRPSSRRALPHRMPPETHWRVVEPVDDLPPEPMSRAEPTAADPIDVAPDVTAPEWVDWVQQTVRRSREQGPPRSPAWPVIDPLADEPGGVRDLAAAPDWPVTDPLADEPGGVRDVAAAPDWPVTDPLADEPGGVRGVAAAPDWTVARPEAPDDTRRRAWLKVLGVAAAAVLAVLLSVGTWWYVGRDDEGQQADGLRAATRAAVAPGPAGAAHVQTRVRVLPDGRLWVRQWIRATRPMASLVLLAPVDPYLERGTVTATRLRVEAGGVPVPGPRQVTLESAAFAFDKTSSVHLSYLLSGALERSPGSTRALARVTSLDLYARPEPKPTSYAFRGARILTLACTPAASAQPPIPCGSQQGRDWTVRFPRATAKRFRVMVQLDLSPHLAGRR